MSTNIDKDFYDGKHCLWYTCESIVLEEEREIINQKKGLHTITYSLYSLDNTLPHHAALTKVPQGSPTSYAVPGSQINTTPINDTVYENTNLPRENSPNYYEFEDDDYTTYNDAIPTNSEANRNPADHTSPESSHTNPSSNIYQEIDFNQAPGPTVNSKDNLGYTDQSNEEPYYFSLEDGTSNENIYDRVTEEPQEHVYSVLEKPN